MPRDNCSNIAAAAASPCRKPQQIAAIKASRQIMWACAMRELLYYLFTGEKAPGGGTLPPGMVALRGGSFQAGAEGWRPGQPSGVRTRGAGSSPG